MVSVPIRGFNDFNKNHAKRNKHYRKVSVPIRGFNDFNKNLKEKNNEKCYVSVPIRGFNDFNKWISKEYIYLGKFPSPYGVLMILIAN